MPLDRAHDSTCKMRNVLGKHVKILNYKINNHGEAGFFEINVDGRAALSAAVNARTTHVGWYR